MTTKQNANATNNTPAVEQGKLIKLAAELTNLTEGEILQLGFWAYGNKDVLIARLKELSQENLTPAEAWVKFFEGAPALPLMEVIVKKVEEKLLHVLVKAADLIRQFLGQSFSDDFNRKVIEDYSIWNSLSVGDKASKAKAYALALKVKVMEKATSAVETDASGAVHLTFEPELPKVTPKLILSADDLLAEDTVIGSCFRTAS